MNLDHKTSKTYTIIACIIGFALIDDLTANEQNALGNFLYLVAQILETNSALQQNIEEKLKGITTNINSKNAKGGGTPFTDNYIRYDVLKKLIKDVDLIKETLENLK